MTDLKGIDLSIETTVSLSLSLSERSQGVSSQSDVPKIPAINLHLVANRALDFDFVADFNVVAHVRAVDVYFSNSRVPSKLGRFVRLVKASTATGRFWFVVVIYRFSVVELDAGVVAGHGETSGGFHRGGGAERGA